MTLMTLLWIVVIVLALTSLLGLSALALTFHYVNVVQPRHMAETEEDDAIVRELDFPIPVTVQDTLDTRAGLRDSNLRYCPACLITLNQPIPGPGVPTLCAYHQRRIARRERVFA